MVGESVVDGGWSGVGASSLKNQTIMLRTKKKRWKHKSNKNGKKKKQKKKLYFFSSCSCSCSCVEQVVWGRIKKSTSSRKWGTREMTNRKREYQYWKMQKQP